MSRSTLSSLHLFGALACAMITLACGKQAEGERCDLNSASLDCDVGLVCTSAEQLSIQGGRGVALCCPPDDVLPTVTACRAGAELPDDLDPPAEPTPTPDAGEPAGDAGL